MDWQALAVHPKATADGVIDAAERAQIEENSYQVMTKWQEHLTLLFRVSAPLMRFPDRQTNQSIARLTEVKQEGLCIRTNIST